MSLVMKKSVSFQHGRPDANTNFTGLNKVWELLSQYVAKSRTSQPDTPRTKQSSPTSSNRGSPEPCGDIHKGLGIVLDRLKMMESAEQLGHCLVQ